MNYTVSKVLNLRPDEVPNFDEYFTGNLDDVERNHRHSTLSVQDTTYLLLPDYERVEAVDWLIEPLTVTKRVKVPNWKGDAIITTSVEHLRRSVVREDGGNELRMVEVDTPSNSGNIYDLDRPFKDEYLTRPLKMVSIGDLVFVVPSFHRYKVVSGRGDGLGFNLVPVVVDEWMQKPMEVGFDDVLVLQRFLCRDGRITKVLLKAWGPGREINSGVIN